MRCVGQIQFQPIFATQLRTSSLPNFGPPGEIKGGKLKGILKYISQNKGVEAVKYTKVVHFSELNNLIILKKIRHSVIYRSNDRSLD